MYGGITMKKRHGILLAVLSIVFALSLVPAAYASTSKWSWDKEDPEFVAMIEEHKVLRDECLETTIPGVDYEIGTIIVSCYDCTLSEFEAFAANAGFTIKDIYNLSYEGKPDVIRGGYLAYPESWTLREAIEIAESYDIIAVADVNGIMYPGLPLDEYDFTDPIVDDPLSPPQLNYLATRIAGETAAETAALISSELGYPYGFVIARDDDYADALGAVALAGELGCQILLTDSESLSPAAAERIASHDFPSTFAYIIGGEAAISPQVVEDLRALGINDVRRIAGENSYDTSLEIAKEIEQYDTPSDKVIVASSMSFQDALSIAPIAYSQKIPIILQTWGDTSADRELTDEARQYILDHNMKVIVVGGEGAVSDTSLEGLRVIKRLWGETGYDTSFAIAKWATRSDVGYLNTNSVVLASGAEGPKGLDALAGSVLAGQKKMPVILVNGNEELGDVDLTAIEKYLDIYDDEVGQIYFLGGTYVMPEEMKYTISNMFTRPFDS